jgi:hypothetical protein
VFDSTSSRCVAVLFLLAGFSSGQNGNGLHNPPVLTSAISLGSLSTVTGYLDSLPADAFHIAIYAGPLGDPSSFGEDCQLLGSLPVTTDASGHVDFVVDLTAPGGEGAFFSATATNVATGDTSGFAACVKAEPWANLGLAKFGSNGTPALSGSGSLTPGSGNQLSLSGACPLCSTTLIVGFSAANLPFHGGTLVPAPLFSLPLRTGPHGGLSLPFVWPEGMPAGLTLYFQVWVADKVSIYGASASNGVAGLSQ